MKDSDRCAEPDLDLLIGIQFDPSEDVDQALMQAAAKLAAEVNSA